MVEFSTISARDVPVIGLTGGIGSGKSTVARIFQSLSVPCFNADLVAKTMYRQELSLREWVVERFGHACGYYENGKLIDISPRTLAQVVFQDEEGLRELNSRVHPLVRASFSEWLKNQTFASPPYCLKESAILFESGSHLDCIATISIHASVNTRIERIIHRDGWDVASIKARMNQQMKEEERMDLATWNVDNNEGSQLLQQVVQLHQSVMEFIKMRRDP